MKLKVYLDTSVFSAFYDQRLPDRLSATREFWLHLVDLEAGTSEISRKEIEETTDPGLRANLLELLASVTVIPVSSDMEGAAMRYVEQGAFTTSMYNDALHVAAAVLTRHDVLVSWNYKHLVNRRRRSLINQINVNAGWPTIEIAAPAEM